MTKPTSKYSKQWLVSLGVSLWVSFLSACVATVFFFSTFDPSLIAQVATFPMHIDRSTGYSIGFFLFWVLLLLNSVTVAWLIKRNPK